jgi:hypothetical protein
MSDNDDLMSNIEGQLRKGKPVPIVGGMTSISSDKVWACDYESAKECLPPGAVWTTVNGRTCYGYEQFIENRKYKFALLINGSTVDTYVREPNIRELGPSEKYHTLGGGKICTGNNSIKSAYANAVTWAAAYNRYLNTGNDSGFRLFDQ